MNKYIKPILSIHELYELKYHICAASEPYEIPTNGETEDLTEEY